MSKASVTLGLSLEISLIHNSNYSTKTSLTRSVATASTILPAARPAPMPGLRSFELPQRIPVPPGLRGLALLGQRPVPHVPRTAVEESSDDDDQTT